MKPATATKPDNTNARYSSPDNSPFIDALFQSNIATMQDEFDEPLRFKMQSHLNFLKQIPFL